MALYATGLRRAELAILKIADIDRKGGKGRKDRDVMIAQSEFALSPARRLRRSEEVLQCSATGSILGLNKIND